MANGELIQLQALHNQDSVMSRPVFILGIAERSGTTYLQDLLRLHPDCDVDGLELDEDHFVAHADLLIKYAALVSKSWKSWSRQEQLQKERDLLCRCLGDGLLVYLNLQVTNKRLLAGIRTDKPLKVLITKTPDVTNVDLFFKIFPTSDLLILVRDGRAVVESAVNTFYRRFDWAARQWATHAETVIRFAHGDSNRGHRYLVVKYEDLYSKTEEELNKILVFLKLDVETYNFKAARALPVRGSCTLRSQGAEWKVPYIAPGIHWRPVPKAPDFDPVNRWSHWNRAKHERFNWIAGDYMAPFGYENKSHVGSGWLWAAWNWLLDRLPVETSLWIFNKVCRELKFSSDKFRTAVRLIRKVWDL